MQWLIRPPGSYFQSWLWNSSDFTAYRNLSPLLFSVSEVVLLFKHVSLLPLMYGKLQSALFENWSTGTKIAKGCTCPNCSILKLTSDQFGAGKSLQLKRCVHGFPLIWVGQTLSYWETLSSSPWIIPIQRPLHFSSGGMGLMGSGWEVALCIGFTKTFHEVQVNTFLWTCTQKPFLLEMICVFTLSVEVSNYTDCRDFSFAWFPTPWSTHLH